MPKLTRAQSTAAKINLRFADLTCGLGLAAVVVTVQAIGSFSVFAANMQCTEVDSSEQYSVKVFGNIADHVEWKNDLTENAARQQSKADKEKGWADIRVEICFQRGRGLEKMERHNQISDSVCAPWKLMEQLQIPWCSSEYEEVETGFVKRDKAIQCGFAANGDTAPDGMSGHTVSFNGKYTVNKVHIQDICPNVASAFGAALGYVGIFEIVATVLLVYPLVVTGAAAPVKGKKTPTLADLVKSADTSVGEIAKMREELDALLGKSPDGAAVGKSIAVVPAGGAPA